MNILMVFPFVTGKGGMETVINYCCLDCKKNIQKKILLSFLEPFFIRRNSISFYVKCFSFV